MTHSLMFMSTIHPPSRFRSGREGLGEGELGWVQLDELGNCCWGGYWIRDVVNPRQLTTASHA